MISSKTNSAANPDLELDSTTPSNGTTSRDGLNPGKLLKLSKSVAKVGVKRRMFQIMLEEKKGTRRIEAEACRLEMEQKGLPIRKKEYSNWGFILVNRCEAKVIDQLNLKIGYLMEAEETTRAEYQLEKKRLREVYSRRGFQRIIARVTKQTQREWKEGLQVAREKIEKVKVRFKKQGKQEQDNPSKKKSREEWVNRVSEGKGKDRPRITVEIAIHGEIHPPIDQDEL